MRMNLSFYIIFHYINFNHNLYDSILAILLSKLMTKINYQRIIKQV